MIAAVVAGFQALLWARVHVWGAMAGAVLLAGLLAYAAARKQRASARSSRIWIASAWSLVALLSILCFAPIRAGAIQSRALERVVLPVLAVMALIALLLALHSVLRAAIRRPGFRKPALIVLGIVLLTMLAADLMQLFRPSGISALACTTTLFRGKPDSRRLLELHHDAITNHSARQNLPAALVAAVIVDHQNQQTTSGDLTDCLGSALGVNLSLGLAQVRLGTAAEVDGKSLASLSPAEFRRLRTNLLNPQSNIGYEARELRALMERPIRFAGMGASELLHNPAAMALLISEYRKGRMPTPAKQSRLTINAFSTLGLMQDGTLARFDRPEDDPAGARSRIREYLGHIYCQSGIFDERACRSWTQSLN